MGRIDEVVLGVARTAVQYATEKGSRPSFGVYARGIIHLALAITEGRELGTEEGWGVFETCDTWWVRSNDQAGKVDDKEAIRLAKSAGIQCDDAGQVVDEDDQPVRLI